MLNCSCVSVRSMHLASRAIRSTIKTNELRHTFLKFFESQGHRHVPSTSVLPFNDPSLDFVNAGMNQFKRVLLGTWSAPHDSVVNYQRCIRVGGKHNDLKFVGNDGYHHTFFEMLGSWTFHSCDKEKACRQAWEFLTTELGLDTTRLYVTFFEGNPEFNIPADEETREIWRKLGISDSRILSFGASENFWEMGPVGPCGPCTEIHYDHLGRGGTAAHRVNTGGQDLVELWNLVFIQYERRNDGSLVKLGTPHVDTGMGLERLMAVLTGTMSNYDTDVFHSIFNHICKIFECPVKYQGKWGTQDRDGIDTGYRILADHIRMISIAIADGALPIDHHRVRKLIRRSLWIMDKVFKSRFRNLGLLAEPVLEELSVAYPSIANSTSEVQTVIRYEADLFKANREQADRHLFKIRNKLKDCHADLKGPLLEVVHEVPGFINAYIYLNENGFLESGCTITGDALHKVHCEYGISREHMETVAQLKQVQLDWKDFEEKLEEYKKLHLGRALRIKTHSVDLEKLSMKLKSKHIEETIDDQKYVFTKQDEKYTFPEIKSEILKVVTDLDSGDLNMTIKEGDTCAIVVKQTNFYSEAGGQVSDIGWISNENGEFEVKDVQKYGGYIYHIGNMIRGELKEGSEVCLKLDSEHRIGCTVHHTATHLLNAAIRQVSHLISQQSSLVYNNGLKFTFSGYRTLTAEQIQEVQDKVSKSIQRSVQVNRCTRTLSDVLNKKNITVLPGEIYPDPLHVIEILDSDLESVEPCCGTHLVNTADIGSFLITRYKSRARGVYEVTATTRDKVDQAVQQGQNIYKEVETLENEFKDKVEPLDRPTVKELRPYEQLLTKWQKLLPIANMPQTVRAALTLKINKMRFIMSEKKFKADQLKRNEKQKPILAETDDWYQVIEDLKKAANQSDGKSAVTTLLDWDINTRMSVTDCVSLVCPNQPAFIIFKQKGKIKVIARVPKEIVTHNGLKADAWITSVESLLNAKGSPVNMWPPDEIYRISGIEPDLTISLQTVVDAAKQYANKFC